jgi:hypothetical protein
MTTRTAWPGLSHPFGATTTRFTLAGLFTLPAVVKPGCAVTMTCRSVRLPGRA